MKGANSDMGQDNTLPGSNGTGDDESPVDPGSGKGSSLRSALDAITKYRLIIGGIVLGVLILIGVVIWVLVGALANRPAAVSTPGPATSTSRGALPANVEAKDYQLGDCFADFDSNALKARAVDCTTDHSAQLGAIFRYKAEDTFPGRDALKQKALETCRTAILSPAIANYTLINELVYPSSDSWNAGDRRVDCFLMTKSGNTIKESLLQK
jgi:hypothetical protein